MKLDITVQRPPFVRQSNDECGNCIVIPVTANGWAGTIVIPFGEYGTDNIEAIIDSDFNEKYPEGKVL